MTKAETLSRLADVQHALLRTAESLDDRDLRTQFHADLSPLGWHLGHCAHIENYWLREVLSNDSGRSAAQAWLYVPERIPRPERGPALPARELLLADVRSVFADSLALLAAPSRDLRAHYLLRDDYLPLFLLQHHAQHGETMQLVLAQRAACRAEPRDAAHAVPPVSPPVWEWRGVDAGNHAIGGAMPWAFDNELPRHTVGLDAFAIASTPVSNGQYAAFMQAGGYRNARHWTDTGWAWRCAHGIERPENWRFLAEMRAAAPWRDTSVCGLAAYEAQAYANWAGARLPHEHEWETACRMGLLEGIGSAWEWCANVFFPYPGFTPFPYDGYSTPWFDGTHYGLRGGSIFTDASVRRCSFRNFYTADKRHIRAGLRLARDRSGSDVVTQNGRQPALHFGQG